MYNTIYQITTEFLPDDDYLSDYDFYNHWFIDKIADHISNFTNRDDEINNLREWLEEQKDILFVDGNSFKVLPSGKEIYFRDAFKRFSEAVKKTADMDLEKFIKDPGCTALVDQIYNNFNDQFGPYVSSDEFDTISFDKFIRSADIGTRYYINGVVNYHS